MQDWPDARERAFRLTDSPAQAERIRLELEAFAAQERATALLQLADTIERSITLNAYPALTIERVAEIARERCWGVRADRLPDWIRHGTPEPVAKREGYRKYSGEAALT